MSTQAPDDGSTRNQQQDSSSQDELQERLYRDYAGYNIVPPRGDRQDPQQQ